METKQILIAIAVIIIALGVFLSILRRRGSQSVVEKNSYDVGGDKSQTIDGDDLVADEREIVIKEWLLHGSKKDTINKMIGNYGYSESEARRLADVIRDKYNLKWNLKRKTYIYS